MSRLYRDLNLPSCSSMDEGKDDAAGRRVDTFTLGGLWSAGLGVFAAVCNPAPTHLAMLCGATPLARPNSAGVKRWAMIYGTPVVISHWYRARPDLLGRLAHPRSVRAEAGGGRQRRRDPADSITAACVTRHLLPTLRDADLPLVLAEAQRLACKLGTSDPQDNPRA